LRQRLRQAFRYLDGLVREARSSQASNLKNLLCPKCGKPYECAAGQSPSGIIYFQLAASGATPEQLWQRRADGPQPEGEDVFAFVFREEAGVALLGTTLAECNRAVAEADDVRWAGHIMRPGANGLSHTPADVRGERR